MMTFNFLFFFFLTASVKICSCRDLKGSGDRFIKAVPYINIRNDFVSFRESQDVLPTAMRLEVPEHASIKLIEKEHSDEQRHHENPVSKLCYI